MILVSGAKEDIACFNISISIAIDTQKQKGQSAGAVEHTD